VPEGYPSDTSHGVKLKFHSLIHSSQYSIRVSTVATLPSKSAASCSCFPLWLCCCILLTLHCICAARYMQHAQ